MVWKNRDVNYTGIEFARSLSLFNLYFLNDLNVIYILKVHILAVFLGVMGWEPRPISGRTSLKCTTWPSHVDRSSLHHCHSSLPRTHHPSNLRNSWNSSPGVLWNWELPWRWAWYFLDPAIFKTNKHEKWWIVFLTAFSMYAQIRRDIAISFDHGWKRAHARLNRPAIEVLEFTSLVGHMLLLFLEIPWRTLVTVWKRLDGGSKPLRWHHVAPIESMYRCWLPRIIHAAEPVCVWWGRLPNPKLALL